MGSAPASPEANAESAKGKLEPAYATRLGKMYQSTIEDALDSDAFRRLRGKVQLIFTSPPFPLNHKKRYGNKTGAEYLEWLQGLAPRLAELLTPDGSVVMEVGNAWVPGKPVMSMLPLQALTAFLEGGELNLCQHFVCHNTARLPGPAQWVTVERIRVKDSFTNVWWMAPDERPKANNRHVLVEYSPAMRGLLKSKKYNAGQRPSGHVVREESFLKDNGGAIPANVLSFSNTRWSDNYRAYCKQQGLEIHPARMQPELAEFFINFLTEDKDIVLDPFGGSNTTGAVAEKLGRRWISVEPNSDYVEGSLGRFPEME